MYSRKVLNSEYIDKRAHRFDLSLKKFEIEFLPHFEQQEEPSNELGNKVDQIKEKVYDRLLHHDIPLDHQDVKTEIVELVAEVVKPSSSYTDLGFDSGDYNGTIVIKTESAEIDFDLEGTQYAEDLMSLSPEQRNIVREVLANIMCKAKRNMLSLEYFQDLLSS